MRSLKPDLWKINLGAFTMLLLLAAGGTWLQIERHNRGFRQEVMEHARLAADIIRLNTENVFIAEGIVKDVFRQFLGNTARFTSYLNMVEPFSADELDAFARESGLAGIGIINATDGKGIYGPGGWQKRLHSRPECLKKGSRFNVLPKAGLMTFVSAVENGYCVIVAVDATQLEQLEKHAGIKKTVEKILRMKGINNITFTKGNSQPETSGEMVFRDCKVSINVSTGAGRLLVEMDAKPFHRIKKRTITYFLLFAAGLLITGGILTLIVYRYQKSYIKRIREIEKRMAEEREAAALGRSAATVAHEIRNPLNSVSMGLQTMRMQATCPESTHALVDAMLREVKRANEIVSQMLRFSSPAKPEMQQVSMKQLVKEQLLLLENRFREQQITVSCKMDDLETVADSSMLTQVISNIFNNVLNAQPHGGFVDISLEKKDKFLVLKISNGGNMPDTDNPDELFKPYFTTGTRGTGLGLAICRKIVKLHEGTIRIVVDDNIFITEIRLPLKG